MRKSLKSFQKDVITDGDFLEIYQISQLENEIKLNIKPQVGKWADTLIEDL